MTTLADLAKQIGRGVLLGVADDSNAAASCGDGVTLGHGLLGVIGALGMHVRADDGDEGADIGLVEDNDGINIGQGGNQFGTFGLRNERAAVAFQRASAGIGIQSDNELSAELFGGVQITDMTDMQKIEAAIGQDDALTRRAPLADAGSKLLAIEDFIH